MKMYHQLFLTLFLSLMCFLPQAQPKLERVKVNKSISLKAPTSFIPLSEGELAGRFVTARTPIAMYTSDDLTMELGVNATSNRWPEGDLEIIQSFYKASIANLFTEVKFIQEDIREIDGRKFIAFEFVSKVSDDGNTFGGVGTISKYTFIQYTIVDERVLLFNFTCPSRKRQEWQPVAREIMASIKIK